MLLHSTDTNDKDILHAILSTIDEGIHAVDAHGITIFYNRIASIHDGIEGDNILGKHLLKTFPSLTVETSTLLKVIQTGEPIYNQQQSYYNSRGALIDTVNTTLPIIIKNEVVGAVEIAKDYTKVKQLSEKLIDLQAEAGTKERGSTPLKSQNGAKYHTRDIITNNQVVMDLKEKVHKVASTTSPVLVYGETGTGKELFVQSIHHASVRKSNPFIAQNCAAIPATLLESVLFGTVKGSYTGAMDRPGLFELANGGTLFLDEINSMPLDIQAKFLRVLENGRVRRIGDTQEYDLDVRIIAAMNEPAEKCLREKTLRQDLYYRLNVVQFHIPPLRERREDIELLINHFIKKFNFKFNRLVTGISDEALHILKGFSWPGNVRELEHAVESAMNIAEGDILKKEHFPAHIMAKDVHGLPSALPLSLKETLEVKEMELINEALMQTNGNVLQAAKLLQIPRQTLQYKIEKFALK